MFECFNLPWLLHTVIIPLISWTILFKLSHTKPASHLGFSDMNQPQPGQQFNHCKSIQARLLDCQTNQTSQSHENCSQACSSTDSTTYFNYLRASDQSHFRESTNIRMLDHDNGDKFSGGSTEFVNMFPPNLDLFTVENEPKNSFPTMESNPKYLTSFEAEINQADQLQTNLGSGECFTAESSDTKASPGVLLQSGGATACGDSSKFRQDWRERERKALGTYTNTHTPHLYPRSTLVNVFGCSTSSKRYICPQAAL